MIDRDPKQSPAYRDLAAALCERALETGDIAYFDLAEEALFHSREIAPDDYAAQKIRITILLGRHRWTEALETAKTLNRRVPDDVDLWGLLSEANFEVGNYDEAEKAAQWMFNLRPGNTAAYLPAARVRETSGDLSGALDYLDEAFRRTPESEWAMRAFFLSESARVQILDRNPKRAADLVQQAFALNPDYHRALQVAAALDPAKAPELLGQRFRQVKTTAALYDWASALQEANRKEEAAEVFKRFVMRAEAEFAQPYNANRQLVFYYSDRISEPAKALRVAERERSVRHDAGTLDAHAWALFHNGKSQEAKAESDTAIATGTRDPLILLHASKIAKVQRLSQPPPKPDYRGTKRAP